MKSTENMNESLVFAKTSCIRVLDFFNGNLNLLFEK